MTLLRNFFRPLDPNSKWEFALIELPSGGELYCERLENKHEVWLFPTGHQGDPSDRQPDERLILDEGTEFEAQMLVDYYLGSHHENRNDL